MAVVFEASTSPSWVVRVTSLAPASLKSALCAKRNPTFPCALTRRKTRAAFASLVVAFCTCLFLWKRCAARVSSSRLVVLRSCTRPTSTATSLSHRGGNARRSQRLLGQGYRGYGHRRRHHGRHGFRRDHDAPRVPHSVTRHHGPEDAHPQRDHARACCSITSASTVRTPARCRVARMAA